MSGDPSYMHIQTETLEQAHEDLQMAFQAIQATLTSLKADLDRTIGEWNWNGQAKDAYRDAQDIWTTRMNDLNDLLGNARQHMISVAEMYQVVENHNISIWHG